jgi:hypothetical protein
VLDRIHAVIYKPRPFVKSEDYFGPCRRRITNKSYAGPWRRESDSKASESAA